MTNTERILLARKELIAVFSNSRDLHLNDLILLALEALKRAEERSYTVSEGQRND